MNRPRTYHNFFCSQEVVQLVRTLLIKRKLLIRIPLPLLNRTRQQVSHLPSLEDLKLAFNSSFEFIFTKKFIYVNLVFVVDVENKKSTTW